jgi:hypothetical protein
LRSVDAQEVRINHNIMLENSLAINVPDENPAEFVAACTHEEAGAGIIWNSMPDNSPYIAIAGLLVMFSVIMD